MSIHWETFIAESEGPVATRFPGLVLHAPENEPPRLEGQIVLEDKGGNPYDQYQVKIIASIDPQMWFPTVFEIGGRLPHNNDWHVFNDGKCCIKSIPEQIIICKKGITLLQFIDEQVLPYFSAQTFRRQNGYFLHERSHGELGNLEYISDLLGTKDQKLIVYVLHIVLKRFEPHRSHRCFCGSGKLYRHCHRKAYRDLKLLPQELIRDYIQILLN